MQLDWCLHLEVGVVRLDAKLLCDLHADALSERMQDDILRYCTEQVLQCDQKVSFECQLAGHGEIS